MERKIENRLERLFTVVLTALALVLLYMIWTHSTDRENLIVISVTSLLISAFFVRTRRFPRITPKRIAYGLAYIPYLFAQIVKANLDVASRVVRRRIPLRPGIVAVTTRLRSPLGRAILANSITLTPGTLSVEMEGDRIFIHWIDVSDDDGMDATERIVSGFERYLEVIFG
jgi:multicomponent Na+:H+ antiporter subunit E